MVEGTRIPEFTVGDRLARARTTGGISVQQMAEALGVDRRTVGRYERSETVKRTIIMAYALRTGVPVEWLETGKYTPWDLNPEPTGLRFAGRRNLHYIGPPPIMGASDLALAVA